MLKTKIASLALAGLMTIGGSGVTALATEVGETAAIQNMGEKSILATDFTANPDSTQEVKLEVLTKIAAAYNPELYETLVEITAQHEAFHLAATATQEDNQAGRALEIATIIDSAKAGEMTKVQAKETLEQMKTETSALLDGLATIKTAKTQEDGQLKADTKALGAELLAEFSSETPDATVINDLLAQLIANQQAHLVIDTTYQAQIDELLATS